jgi:hypothetical protein
MKSKILLITFLTACFSTVASTAMAQMKPGCYPPENSGACFLDNFPHGIIYCDGEAGIAWSAPPSKNDFLRFTRNGNFFTHTGDIEVDAVVCKWGDLFTGACGTQAEPGPAMFIGKAHSSTRGFIQLSGEADCPLRIMLKGSAFREFDQGMVDIDMIFHVQKDVDSPTGCRVKTCKILSEVE